MPVITTQAVFQRVAERIREDIAGGRYPSGTFLEGERAIADRLGVSRPSVRRAIRELEAEGVLQCRPSLGTLVRAAPRRQLVGYLAPNLQDPFHLELIRELQLRLEARGAGLLVAQGSDSRALREQGAARIIACGQVEPAGVPQVCIGGGPPGVATVAIDNTAGMRLVCEHLLAQGCRRIAYAGPAGEDARWLGLLDACGGLAVAPGPRFGLPSPDAADCDRLLADLLAGPRPDALVCYNDWLASRVLMAAQARGLAVPAQLALTGFDDLFTSRLLAVPLTTVAFPVAEAAERLLELLFAPAGEPPRRIVLPARLVVRASSLRLHHTEPVP